MYCRLLLLGTLVIMTLAGLSGCGGVGRGPIAVGALDDVEPYVASGRYASVLKGCVTAQQSNQSCTLETLPPIAMEYPTPDIDAIMARVLVSDPWMGQRFEELLAVLPNDIHQLLGAVTAVVIDGDIRPSYYLSMTGAIYLDPENLWLLVSEKRAVNQDPDYRRAFAEPLTYRSFWRYVKGGRNANSYTPGPDGSRTLADIEMRMASLLFHELAHANDFFPPVTYDRVDPGLSYLRAASSVYEERPSTYLTNFEGLASAEMFRVASILYKGVPPNDNDRKITAAQVGGFFEPDAASDDYAYSSQYEDLAMLFEEAMMKLHYDTERDMAFIVASQKRDAHCNDELIGWGVRNRLAAAQVVGRAEWAVQQMLPLRNYSDFFAELDPPQPLPVGQGWCESITLDRPFFARSEKLRAISKERPSPLLDQTRLYPVFK